MVLIEGVDALPRSTHAGPFVLEFQRHRAEVHLKHGQVISRLIQDPRHAQSSLALTLMRAMLVAKDRARLRHIEASPGSVNQTLERAVQGTG